MAKNNMKRNRRAEEIIKAFGERTYRKGEEYFKERKVVGLVVDGDKAMGQVVGRADRPYHVTLTWAKHVSSSCSCPVGDMCKHGVAVALAFISYDTERVDMERVRKEIDGLGDKEARRVLVDCMALEPRLATLLSISNDGSRVDRVLDHLDRSLGNERQFGLPVSLCYEVDLAVRSARNWRGGEVDKDRLRLILEISDRLLKYLKDSWSDIDDQGPYRAIQMLSDLLPDSLDALTEDELRHLFETLRGLSEADEYDIGTEKMLEVVAAKIGQKQ
jgi:hypothetical protein